MGLFLGIDVGAVSLKMAVLADEPSLETLRRAASDTITTTAA